MLFLQQKWLGQWDFHTVIKCWWLLGDGHHGSRIKKPSIGPENGKPGRTHRKKKKSAVFLGDIHSTSCWKNVEKQNLWNWELKPKASGTNKSFPDVCLMPWLKWLNIDPWRLLEVTNCWLEQIYPHAAYAFLDTSTIFADEVDINWWNPHFCHREIPHDDGTLSIWSTAPICCTGPGVSGCGPCGPGGPCGPCGPCGPGGRRLPEHLDPTYLRVSTTIPEYHTKY